jgi:hypothetical protein
MRETREQRTAGKTRRPSFCLTADAITPTFFAIETFEYQRMTGDSHEEK